MTACLFGLEAELAVGATGWPQGTDASTVAVSLMGEASEHLSYLRGGGSRLFLSNGGLLYLDGGSHPEVATAECCRPADAVAHFLAGQRLVAELAEGLGRRLGLGRIHVLRNNVDYHAGTTWGCHESYLARRPARSYVGWLVPHLVSRLVFCGAGGLDPASPGIRFSLSPRAAFFTQAVADCSTGERPIFHLKDEPLCRGYSRIHVIAGDNACSQRATWLKVASTALLVAVADHVPEAAAPIRLPNPVGAMRTFARDPLARIPVVLPGGARRTCSAFDLQRLLLEQIEERLRHGALPDWAEDACVQWRAALDTPQHGTDWSLKFGVFRREMQRLDFTPAAVSAWSDALEGLPVPGHATHGQPVMFESSQLQVLQAAGAQARADLADARARVEAQGESWTRLEAFLALRHHLCATDIRFGELGQGVFDSLDGQGLLPDHRMVSEDAIRTAMTHPPCGSRAWLRGRWIRRLARRRDAFRCEWDGIMGLGRRLDLSDPFARGVRFAEDTRPSDPFWCDDACSRTSALAAFVRGDFRRAEEITCTLIAQGFELASSYTHLARALLCQGEARFDEAMRATEEAWAHRHEGPPYVVLRTLWLQLAMLYCATDQAGSATAARSVLGQIKYGILEGGSLVFLDWTMHPVMRYLQSRVTPAQLELLGGLVEVLSLGPEAVALAEYPEWCEAQGRAWD